MKEFQDKGLNKLIKQAIEEPEQKLKPYIFKSVHEKCVAIYTVSARSEEEAIEKVKYKLFDFLEIVYMADIMADMRIISLDEMNSDRVKDTANDNPPEELADNIEELPQYILRTIEDMTTYYKVNAFSEDDAWDTVYRDFEEGICVRQEIIEGPEFITEKEMDEEWEQEGKFTTKLIEETKDRNVYRDEQN